MTTYPAISLHQPWATLIAAPARVDCPHDSSTGIDQSDGPDKVWRCDCCGALYRYVPAAQGGVRPVPVGPMVKRYETRSRPCPPKYIGQRIAIHAAKRPPIEGAGIGRYVTTRRPDVAMPDGTRIPGRWIVCDWDAPYEVVPVPLSLGAVVATAIVTASLPILRDEDDDDWGPCVLVPPTSHPEWPALVQMAGEVGRAGTDVSDQVPYGDWTPGRFAWQLDDVQPVDPPVPAVGRQGWFTVNL